MSNSSYSAFRLIKDLPDTVNGLRIMHLIASFFRKSLHHPYPASLDDCRSSLEWMGANFDQIGGRPDQTIAMGLSAKGGLVVALAKAARDENLPKIGGQIIIAVMLGDVVGALSDINPRFVTWSREQNRLAWSK